MKKMGFTLLFVSLVCLCSCQKELLRYGQGDLQVCIEQGDAYLHDFPLFLGIKKKNPPQMAVWIEDMQGNYLSTLYVTRKIAAADWQSAGGNRRKEALPHWCYARGVQYEDGLYLPTKKQPFADGISGATPRESFDIKLMPSQTFKECIVKIEVNHSTDFNESYPETAREGEKGYSGGKEGSGQPSVVYAAHIDLSAGNKTFEAVLIGHSSPDGTSGLLQEDISGLTTALHIIKYITISIQ